MKIMGRNIFPEDRLSEDNVEQKQLRKTDDEIIERARKCKTKFEASLLELETLLKKKKVTT